VNNEVDSDSGQIQIFSNCPGELKKNSRKHSKVAGVRVEI
jgi:hypothetical protein